MFLEQILDNDESMGLSSLEFRIGIRKLVRVSSHTFAVFRERCECKRRMKRNRRQCFVTKENKSR
jgi:hypothetical protein